MHGNNDKKDEGIRWIPTERVGPDKYKKETPQRESSKPNTQLGSSSATGASSSKGKS